MEPLHNKIRMIDRIANDPSWSFAQSAHKDRLCEIKDYIKINTVLVNINASYDIYYSKINYELAYVIEYVQAEEKQEPDMAVVVLAGTRENFYNELKRYWK